MDHFLHIDIKKKFGVRVFQLRNKAGMTQAEPGTRRKIRSERRFHTQDREEGKGSIVGFNGGSCIGAWGGTGRTS
jgi:hypothetical protein